MGGSWWRGLTECGPLEKGMANHFSILASRTPWTVWKGWYHIPSLMLGCTFSLISDSCDPIDCSLPGSSVPGILQARIVEWVAISFSRGSSQPRDQTHVSYIGRRILYHWPTWEYYLLTRRQVCFWEEEFGSSLDHQAFIHLLNMCTI